MHSQRWSLTHIATFEPPHHHHPSKALIEELVKGWGGSRFILHWIGFWKGFCWPACLLANSVCLLVFWLFSGHDHSGCSAGCPGCPPTSRKWASDQFFLWTHLIRTLAFCFWTWWSARFWALDYLFDADRITWMWSIALLPRQHFKLSAWRRQAHAEFPARWLRSSPAHTASCNR